MELFDTKLVELQQRRALSKSSEFNFFHNETKDILKDHLELLGRNFSTHKILGNFSLENSFEMIGKKTNGASELVISLMEIHYQNNPLDYIKTQMDCLIDNGVFIGIFLGGYTLTELRNSFMETESKLLGGVSPRVIPMIDVKDAGKLMQLSGFNNPMSDVVTLELCYSKLVKLFHELRYSGLSNPLINRERKYLNRNFFKELEHYYSKNHSTHEKSLVATFEFITVTGFKNPSNKKPL